MPAAYQLGKFHSAGSTSDDTSSAAARPNGSARNGYPKSFAAWSVGMYETFSSCPVSKALPKRRDVDEADEREPGDEDRAGAPDRRPMPARGRGDASRSATASATVTAASNASVGRKSGASPASGARADEVAVAPLGREPQQQARHRDGPEVRVSDRLLVHREPRAAEDHERRRRNDREREREALPRGRRRRPRRRARRAGSRRRTRARA